LKWWAPFKDFFRCSEERKKVGARKILARFFRLIEHNKERWTLLGGTLDAKKRVR
jgi:hypothetical protein